MANKITGIDVGDLGKPMNTLFKKVSDALGAIYAPKQLVRLAKAKAEAGLITAQNKIAVTDLERRAAQRWRAEESMNQHNIETITEKAFPHLKEDTDASKMDNDWVRNFFQGARMISDSDMQDMLAAILAGEANAPNSFSKRTVNILSQLSKFEAEKFSCLARFALQTDGGFVSPFIYTDSMDYYVQYGISYEELITLNEHNLIHDRPVSIGFQSDETIAFQYFNSSFKVSRMLALPATITLEPTPTSIHTGTVEFTQFGRELFSILPDIKPVDGFVDFVKGKISERGNYLFP